MCCIVLDRTANHRSSSAATEEKGAGGDGGESAESARLWPAVQDHHHALRETLPCELSPVTYTVSFSAILLEMYHYS